MTIKVHEYNQTDIINRTDKYKDGLCAGYVIALAYLLYDGINIGFNAVINEQTKNYFLSKFISDFAVPVMDYFSKRGGDVSEMLDYRYQIGKYSNLDSKDEISDMLEHLSSLGNANFIEYQYPERALHMIGYFVEGQKHFLVLPNYGVIEADSKAELLSWVQNNQDNPLIPELRLHSSAQGIFVKSTNLPKREIPTLLSEKSIFYRIQRVANHREPPLERLSAESSPRPVARL